MAQTLQHKDFMKKPSSHAAKPNEETGEVLGERFKLDVAHCQYGVPSQSVYHGYISDCGKPAIAKWVWGSSWMFVCEEHDRIVEENEP